MKPKPDQKSLYELLSRLHLQIVNERDLGSLLGYCLVDSLLPFQSISGDRDERKFEQVKLVYDGLDRLVQSSETADPYIILCGMKSRVDPAFDQYASKNFSETVCDLVQAIFRRITERSGLNHEDSLVRDGIALYHRVIGEGQPSEGKRSVLTQDYRSIEAVFVRGVR